MHFYCSPSFDATLNLALEELLVREGEDCFMLWRNSPSVIIGRNQNTAAEVNAAALRVFGIPAVRRITGGGAVYHDLGNINFSYICSAEIHASPEVCCGPITRALQKLGWSGCSFSGRNDIVLDGVKISGCARCVQAGRMLFHGTLLYDADLEMLSKVLNPDPEKIRSKGIASVRSRVGNLRSMGSGKAPETAVFLQSLEKTLAEVMDFSLSVPPDRGIMERALHLAETRYRTQEWNWGSPFPYDIVRKKRFPSGSVAAEMQILENRIAGIRFTGDFFSTRPAEDLAAKLTGLPLQREALLPVLEKESAETYFTGITAPEILELLCP